MSLRTSAFPLLLNTSDHDLIRDFFAPALAQAVRYDRGVGYFSSGWLHLATPQVYGFNFSLTIFAIVGALAVMALVVSLASEGRRMSSFTLLLTGVTINSIAMAAILFLHYSAGLTQSFAIVRWLMGGIDSPAPGTLLAGLMKITACSGTGLPSSLACSA